jgi:NADH-quinone oxidoreductase subunit E
LSGHLSSELRAKAEAIVACYPRARSALIPLCHLAQSQDGWLRPEAIEEIAELVGCSPAEVRGTASFYDMFHTEPVGRYLISICTNVSCMLQGAYELLDHAKSSLGISPGQTTADGQFTLEEAECLAGCDHAPCVQVNYRFFGPLGTSEFDSLVEDLSSGRLDDTVPQHGVLSRVERSVALPGRSARLAQGGNDPVAEVGQP